MDHLWAQESTVWVSKLGKPLSLVWLGKLLCWEPWGLSSQSGKGNEKRITQQLTKLVDPSKWTSPKTKPLIIIDSPAFSNCPYSTHGANSAPPAVQTKTLGFSLTPSLFHPTSNASANFRYFCLQTHSKANHFLSSPLLPPWLKSSAFSSKFLNSLPALNPYSVCSQVG